MQMLLDESSIQKQLKELNKAYYTDEQLRSMLQDVNLAEQRAVSAQSYDYSQAVSDAYSSYLQNRNSIYDSALGQGYKQKMVEQNQMDLQSAYEQYRQNYLSNASAIGEQFSESRQSINDIYAQQEKVFASQASKLQDYYGAHFDYVNYLYNQNPELFDRDVFNNLFMTGDTDVRRIMTTDELMQRRVDEQGNEIGFYDAEGNITQRGLDILALLESTGLYEGTGGYSFGTYLRDKNKALWEWANETTEGYDRSNSELFRQMAGIENYTLADKDMYDYRVSNVADKWENEFVDLTSANVIDDRFMDDKAKEYLSSQKWKIDKSRQYTPTEFVNDIANITANQAGVTGGKRGDIVRQFVDGINNGTVKNGTIVDVNYGGGEKLYVYWNGNIYELDGEKTLNDEEASKRAKDMFWEAMAVRTT